MLPDPQILQLSAVLSQRCCKLAEGLTAGSAEWRDLFDASLQKLFDIYVDGASADEGTLWLLNAADHALVPAYNNGPQADDFVGKFQQPLDRGIISTVLATQSATCESYVYRSMAHDPSANRALHVITVHMVAVPLFFGNETRGIISCVKLRSADLPPDDDPPPFGPEALSIVRRLGVLMGEMIDARLAKTVLGGR